MTTYTMIGAPNYRLPRNPDALPVYDFVNGPDNQLCASCDHVILANIWPDQVEDIAIECPSCGMVNIPMASEELPDNTHDPEAPLLSNDTGLDLDHLAAIGLLSLTWSNLEYDFQQIIWAVASWQQSVGELVTLDMGNVSRSNLLRGMSRAKLVGDDFLSELDAVTSFIDQLRMARNDIINAIVTRTEAQSTFSKSKAGDGGGRPKTLTVIADQEHCLNLIKDISLARLCAIALAKSVTLAYHKGSNQPRPLADRADASPHIEQLRSRLGTLKRLRSGGTAKPPPRPSPKSQGVRGNRQRREKG